MREKAERGGDETRRERKPVHLGNYADGTGGEAHDQERTRVGAGWKMLGSDSPPMMRLLLAARYKTVFN